MFEDRNRKTPLEEIPPEERKIPLFNLGQIVGTPGAVAALEDSGELGVTYLQRHHCGNWGELESDDWAANDSALSAGNRLLSAYVLANGEKLWIITEWDRSVTTLLLPSEY